MPKNYYPSIAKYIAVVLTLSYLFFSISWHSRGIHYNFFYSPVPFGGVGVLCRERHMQIVSFYTKNG
ncbi:unnamed protein product [Meloidogyne enterolobii]|uniref:Uncharacterized protein n=1 Tax=Meloidogyne enterolobii TaxID=390850 RepID=A0ACB0ZVC4_MELEN